MFRQIRSYCAGFDNRERFNFHTIVNNKQNKGVNMKLKISIKDPRALEILDMAGVAGLSWVMDSRYVTLYVADKTSMSEEVKQAMVAAMEMASDYELS